MNQPYDPNQQGWGQPGGSPSWGQNQQGGGQPGQGGYEGAQQWGQPQTGGQQAWGQQGGQGAWGQQPAYGASQPFPQAQGAQPWGSAPQKSGNGKMIALLVGAVALLTGIGVALWLILGSDGRSVEDTIEGFVAAAKDGDVDAAKEFTCDKLDAQMNSGGDVSGIEDAKITVNKVDEDGDKATAHVTVTVAGESEDDTLELTKNDDDDWEICGFS